MYPPLALPRSIEGFEALKTSILAALYANGYEQPQLFEVHDTPHDDAHGTVTLGYEDKENDAQTNVERFHIEARWGCTPDTLKNGRGPTRDAYTYVRLTDDKGKILAHIHGVCSAH